MLRRFIVALVAAAPLLMLSVAAHAQSMDLRTTPSPRERVAPSVPGRALQPPRPVLPDRPSFIAPLSKDTKTGRAGVAGWSAPNPAVGSRMAGDHENPGWPGAGFAIEWGRPDRTN